MHMANLSGILVENRSISSRLLNREVKIDLYLPRNVQEPTDIRLLLINDGQDLEPMGFAGILEQLNMEDNFEPLLCVGIHAGKDRRREYGVASQPDYNGRGDRAGLYTSFIKEELLPYLNKTLGFSAFKEMAFAGFSLGGLSALDIVWNNPSLFNRVGVFSGSLWWRSVGQEEEEYDDDIHRIMHQEIRKTDFTPWLKFYFQCGNMDEIKDRNENGIIDSIDDTLDMIKELEAKGYRTGHDIMYVLLPDGRHDVPTWGRAMPGFLTWGWKRERQ